MAKVRLFDGDEVIGLVQYTENLDHWDGRNSTSGRTGRHIGVGKLKDGRFYVCRGTQWQGERDFAEVITKEEAKVLCIEHNPEIYEDFFGEAPPDLTAEEEA